MEKRIDLQLFAVKNYDPNDVIVAFAGRTITGFSDGTYVTASKDEAKWETHVGAQGEVTRSRNRHPIGRITFTLKRSSPDIDFLLGKMNSNDIDPCNVVDRNQKNVTAGGSEAWIAEFPDFEATEGDDVPEIEFEIEVADFELRA